MYETGHTHFKGLKNTKCIQQHHCNSSLFFYPLYQVTCMSWILILILKIFAYITLETEMLSSADQIHSQYAFKFWLKTLSDIKPDISVHKNKTERCVLSLMDGAQGCTITSTSAHAKNIHRRGGAKPTPKHLHILKFSQCAERFNRQKLAVGKWHGWAWLERLPATLISHTTHPSEENIYRMRAGEVEKKSKATFWWRMTEVYAQRGLVKGEKQRKKTVGLENAKKLEKRNYVIKKKDNKY